MIYGLSPGVMVIVKNFLTMTMIRNLTKIRKYNKNLQNSFKHLSYVILFYWMKSSQKRR